MRSLLLVFALLTSIALPAAVLAQQEDTKIALLRAEIERLAGALHGVAGVSVRHLESGESTGLNEAESFPMASTYKIPIALQLLSRVDRGELQLDDPYVVQPDDIIDTHSAIRQHLLPGAQLTVRNLLFMMLRYSDNIATDIVLRLAGGPAEVTAKMRELDLDIRVDRPTWELILDFYGVAGTDPNQRVSAEDYAAVMGDLDTMFEAEAMTNPFYADPRDTATPRAMARLLEGIWRKAYLSAGSSNLLVEILYGTTTGTQRLKGMLPDGTRVAHKTGTIGRTINDVGIIDLPFGAGHVVVVVFTKLSKLPQSEDRERVIAQIARAVHDYFVFRHGAATPEN